MDTEFSGALPFRITNTVIDKTDKSEQNIQSSDTTPKFSKYGI